MCDNHNKTCTHTHIKMETVVEGRLLLVAFQSMMNLYFTHGARSSKKVEYFHNFIKSEITKCIPDSKRYAVELEKYVPSTNSTGRKRCDIVIFRNGAPFLVFPVKLIMTNYKQNKNNYFEQLLGELQCLKWANPSLHIIPINIILNKVPYLSKKTQHIEKFETVSHRDDLQIYDLIREKNITHANMNYIIDVEHVSCVGEKYDKLPHIVGFNVHTKYVPISQILSTLIV